MRNWIKRSVFVVLGLMGFNAPNALAAVDMVLCIDGEYGNPNDTKTDTGCIDVLAWSWGTSNSSIAGGSGKANFQDISITKYQDDSTVYMLNRVADSKSIPAMELRVRPSACKTCPATPVFQLKMPSGSVVTSVSTGGSGGEDKLTENISINFPKIQWCKTELDEAGAPTGTACGGWDIIGNVPYNP